MENKPSERSYKGPIIIIVIILVVLVALFTVPFIIIHFKSLEQCGEGGQLLGSATDGYYCGYKSVCEDCESGVECPDCGPLCESKDKVLRNDYCGPSEIDLTGRIMSGKKAPINCYCCCDEIGEN